MIYEACNDFKVCHSHKMMKGQQKTTAKIEKRDNNTTKRWRTCQSAELQRSVEKIKAYSGFDSIIPRLVI